MWTGYHGCIIYTGWLLIRWCYASPGKHKIIMHVSWIWCACVCEFLSHVVVFMCVVWAQLVQLRFSVYVCARTSAWVCMCVSHTRLSYPKREKESGESSTMQLYCAAIFGRTMFWPVVMFCGPRFVYQTTLHMYHMGTSCWQQSWAVCGHSLDL